MYLKPQKITEITLLRTLKHGKWLRDRNSDDQNVLQLFSHHQKGFDQLANLVERKKSEGQNYQNRLG